MVGALVVLMGFLLAVLVQARSNRELRARIKALEAAAVATAGGLVALRRDVTKSHAQLADRLWQRAQAEVDEEIGKARARFQ